MKKSLILLISGGVIILVPIGIFVQLQLQNTPSFSNSKVPVTNDVVQNNNTAVPEEIENVNENVVEEDSPKKVENPYAIPSNWILFNGDLLGFTMMIPPTWSKSSAKLLYEKPTDPMESESYFLANRKMEDLMSEMTKEDVGLDIDKFRKQGKTFDQIIEKDNEFFNVTLLSEFTVDGHRARTFHRTPKPDYGSEIDFTTATYIEDADGVYRFDAFYEDQKKFEELHQTTIDKMIRSFKKID